MDGTTYDLIIIPIVTTLSLAVCLLLVAHAAAHPSWDRGRTLRRHAEAPVAARAPAGAGPSSGRPARPDTRLAPAA
jgi:hypothetical protein